MIGIVYLVRSKTTGKVYIGRTTQALALRWAGHVHDSKGNVVTGIHGAIKREGPDNFTIEELERHPDKASLMVAERDAIERYNARDPNVGYNLMIGYKARGEVEDTKLLTKSLHVRMTEAEYRGVLGAASSEGRTVSNWARAHLVGVLGKSVVQVQGPVSEADTTVMVATEPEGATSTPVDLTTGSTGVEPRPATGVSLFTDDEMKAILDEALQED